jgi:hypothetical protein
MLWQAWLAPRPLPPFLRYEELAWGRGGDLAGQVLSGISEWGRGVTLASLFSGLRWRLNLAGENRFLIPRSKMASGFGNLFWRFNLAVSFRGSIWQVYSAGRFGRFVQRGWVKKQSKTKKRKVKHVLFCRPVISHHNDTVYNQVV